MRREREREETINFFVRNSTHTKESIREKEDLPLPYLNKKTV
jgi:hypothetical protein